MLRLSQNLPGEMSAGLEGMHVFIKWSKTEPQMGKCVEHTKGRHMCPVSAMESYRECCHCSTHSSPLFHFKDGRPLTSKSFRSTFQSLDWYGGAMWLRSSQYNTHIGRKVFARASLPTDTIQNLGRGEAKHTRHILVQHS